MSRDSSRSSASGRDPNTDGMVAMLQRELTPPRDPEVVARHLEMMFLEFEWGHASRRSEISRGPRARRRARAIVSTCAFATALSLTGGLAAAGALPASAEHWLHRVSRAVGLHLADPPGRALGPPRVDRVSGDDATSVRDLIRREGAARAPHTSSPGSVVSTPVGGTDIAPTPRLSRLAAGDPRPGKGKAPTPATPASPTTPTPPTPTPPTPTPPIPTPPTPTPAPPAPEPLPTPGPAPGGNPSNPHEPSHRPEAPVGKGGLGDGPVGGGNAGAGGSRPDNPNAASAPDNAKSPHVPRAPRN